MRMILSETLLPSISSHFSSLSPLSSNYNSNLATNLLLRGGGGRSSSSKLRFLPPPRSAIEKEEPSSELGLDREKAREALQQLDQQLQSLAQKEQTQLPKSRNPPPYSDINLDRDVITGMESTGEMPEISRSYLSYSAVAFVILTIFNNIIFNVFIKPSVDGIEQASTIERVPLKEP